jgi:hypothetical protein
MKKDLFKSDINFTIKYPFFEEIKKRLEGREVLLVIVFLAIVSVLSFWYYYENGLGLAYNDARSHLNIGRRVVEGLNPGFAQLGSVWLPLPHFLMIITSWNDFMWHSGLSGALQSMVAFIGTGLLIYLFIKELGGGMTGRIFGVLIFVFNINILYLQSTAMTELLLLFTMTAGSYYILLWQKRNNLSYLIYSAFWIMLSTLIRYDGWFLFFFASVFVFLQTWRSYGYKTAEGKIILFCSLGGFGIVLWFLWNQLIFGDALYFIYGPYSAYAQQLQFEEAGKVFTKLNFLFSLKTYIYALAYNSGVFVMMLGFLGMLVFWFSKTVPLAIRLTTTLLIAPFIFNIIALYFGHSILIIPGISGDTLFNIRYGIMMMPSLAIFLGYLIHRAVRLRFVLVGLIIFITFFSFVNGDAITVDDAKFGSSQKNVKEISKWLQKNTLDKKGFILASAASHDAVIFSSGLPMKRFIHEGTGAYYDNALSDLDRWVRWIIVNNNSNNDFIWEKVKDNPELDHFELIESYPFADVYQLKDEYLDNLITEPILEK